MDDKEEQGMARKKVILLVEDNPDDELLTIRAIKKNKIADEITVAHDGAEAIDYIFATGMYEGRDVSKNPQVILLDLNLPKIHGLEVLRRIRNNEKTRCLPVVILTSSTEEEDLIKSYSLGANSYICKPTDFTQFVEAVQQLGTYWLGLNESPPQVHQAAGKK